MQDFEVGMSGEKDGSRFEAASGGAAEICERKGTESGPAGAEEEVVCSWELLALSSSVVVANVQGLVGEQSDSVHEPGIWPTSRLGQLVSMPEIRARAGVFVDPNECFVARNATVFKSGN